MTATDPLLARITDMVVRGCAPKQVLLFGSRAKGLADANSDIDLLVVGDFRESRFLRGREVREHLCRLVVPVDLLFVTPAELEFEARRLHGFFASILEQAQVLYERHPHV